MLSLTYSVSNFMINDILNYVIFNDDPIFVAPIIFGNLEIIDTLINHPKFDVNKEFELKKGDVFL